MYNIWNIEISGTRLPRPPQLRGPRNDRWGGDCRVVPLQCAGRNSLQWKVGREIATSSAVAGSSQWLVLIDFVRERVRWWQYQDERANDHSPLQWMFQSLLCCYCLRLYSLIIQQEGRINPPLRIWHWWFVRKGI